MNIGQAAKTSGVSERMIRHYEKIGLVPPASRRYRGYRAYSPTEIERFRFIANARDLGFRIEEIARLLVLWSDRNSASAEVKKLALMTDRKSGVLGKSLSVRLEHGWPRSITKK